MKTTHESKLKNFKTELKTLLEKYKTRIDVQVEPLVEMKDEVTFSISLDGKHTVIQSEIEGWCLDPRDFSLEESPE